MQFRTVLDNVTSTYIILWKSIYFFKTVIIGIRKKVTFIESYFMINYCFWIYFWIEGIIIKMEFNIIF